MPNALIADDEEAPRAQLVATLRAAWPALHIVQECANGVDAWDAFLEHEPDICFLDVRMPGLTGIEVAQRIGVRAHPVFVTAPGDHALAAFEAGEVEHVRKPVDAASLAPTVARLQARLTAPGAAPADLRELLNRLVGQLRKPSPLDLIETGIGKEARAVRVENVVYLESEGRHTRVVCVDAAGSAELLLRKPLKELTAELDPAQFWQIQRSIIVNRRHIAGAVRLDDDTMVVTLHDRSERLPVARHFQGQFRGP